MAMNIWSAAMTDSGDYGAFMASRLFAGIMGASVSIREYYSRILLDQTRRVDKLFYHSGTAISLRNLLPS